MTKSTLAVALAALTAGASSALGYTDVSANITTDATWTTAGSPYILNGPIYVTSGATLTIQPGVVVRGQPVDDLNDPGTLIIAKTGMINAQGTEQFPIIFTTAAIDENHDGVADVGVNGFIRHDGTASADEFLDASPATAPLPPLNPLGEQNIALWGGVIILGNAPTNLGTITGAGGDAEAGKGNIEGLAEVANSEFGGFDPHDNSGILRYASIRHGGVEIGDGNEINGLTLGGVGAGTQIDHIEVYCTWDDGIEIFGGTVNISHIAVIFAGDDSLDFDEGYTGFGQFLFVVMPYFTQAGSVAYGSGSGDKSCEWDGDDADAPRGADGTLNANGIPVPFSNCRIFNVTIVGSNLPATSAATRTNGLNGQIKMRHGFNGWMGNSIVVNTGTPLDLDDAAGFTDPSVNAAAGTLGLGGITFNATPWTAITDAGAPEQTALNNGGGHYFYTAGSRLVGADQNYNGADTLNPRPTGAPPQRSSYLAVPNNPFFQSVGFRGAFDSSASISLWTTGWTAANIRGFLAD